MSFNTTKWLSDGRFSKGAPEALGFFWAPKSKKGKNPSFGSCVFSSLSERQSRSNIGF